MPSYDSGEGKNEDPYLVTWMGVPMAGWVVAILCFFLYLHNFFISFIIYITSSLFAPFCSLLVGCKVELPAGEIFIGGMSSSSTRPSGPNCVCASKQRTVRRTLALCEAAATFTPGSIGIVFTRGHHLSVNPFIC